MFLTSNRDRFPATGNYIQSSNELSAASGSDVQLFCCPREELGVFSVDWKEGSDFIEKKPHKGFTFSPEGTAMVS